MVGDGFGVMVNVERGVSVDVAVGAVVGMAGETNPDVIVFVIIGTGVIERDCVVQPINSKATNAIHRIFATVEHL